MEGGIHFPFGQLNATSLWFTAWNSELVFSLHFGCDQVFLGSAFLLLCLVCGFNVSMLSWIHIDFVL